MSYDIKWRVKVEDSGLWVNIEDYPIDANITYNVRDIITKSTNLEWKNEADNGLVKDIIPRILYGYQDLLINGDKYRPLEPKNGYGSVEGVRRFFLGLVESWEKLCNDPYMKPYIPYLHFWIV